MQILNVNEYHINVIKVKYKIGKYHSQFTRSLKILLILEFETLIYI